MSDEIVAQFEAADPAERARMIAEHHDNKLYWGWCQKCHHKVEGALKELRGSACPNCGFGAATPDIIHAPE